MEKPRLSVIIPVYNGAKYLGKMLDSVLNQTMTDFELLVVDNNSTDSTGEILERYQKRDGRVHRLFQKKPGVSAARNLALEQFSGEYVMFLDGDDWVDADYFETFLDAMDQADLVSAGYRAYFERGEEGNHIYECFYESPQIETTSYTAAEMLERLFQVTHYQGYVWNKCYRGEMIRQFGLRFCEDISYNEDRLFTVEYLLHCDRAKMLGVNKYHYILHAGNAVSAEIGEFPMEKEFTEIEAFDRMLSMMESRGKASYGNEVGAEELHWKAANEKALKEQPSCEKTLKGQGSYENALQLARINMAERELLLFSRMVDPHGFARYRKSRLRHHARRFGELQYTPKDKEEAKLCRKLIFYGWTGICYGKK